MVKVAIYSVYYIITMKNYVLTDNIFMIASSLVGSIFIFVIRYIIEIQRRLAFNNWNKQTKQIIKLKINLKEEKDRSSVTNIEEIYDIINESIGNYYDPNAPSKEKDYAIVNNLKKILNILKEDNLFSPDLRTINKKNYNHIYGYMMDIKKNKQRSEVKGEPKEQDNEEHTEDGANEGMEEGKEESETESLVESMSDVWKKQEPDLLPKKSSKKEEIKLDQGDFDINVRSGDIAARICNTKFLNRDTTNDDIFTQLGMNLLTKCYTANHNVTEHCNILVNNLDTANILRDNEMAAFLLAALGHDIGHFGRTNLFLKNSSNFLSVIYNDKSILENYHCSYLFHILFKEQNNIFKNESAKTVLNLRQEIIQVILATDMSKHIKILAQFRIKSIKIRSYIEKNIILCLKMIIKAADLSHNCVDWSEHYLWVKRLVNEFYYEGDEQLEKGYQINPLFDRNSHDNFIKIQRTFLKELVFPLIISLKTLDRTSITQFMMDKVKRNYSKWKKIEKNPSKKKKYLNELISNIPDSWKKLYHPNLDIYQLQKCT
ncbi:3',5'-cyclic-nucleotide phosphodiesterase [Plasmodium cynomolgi strain B]|uniref:Phosphodiesterase n=1 Tax=Plasmodium cynomolgi (strain B) TaxID=1120755 RepID=K6UYD0_PLACD|nr:3',5'-cyclic-nucleotide phosphodiesterase [Plasmodium cynomolgi strain B]GAB68879.1 3',5'-cyclic-nucleotide phosphodiesterase [Plasmodium cynomolgi strain B]